MAKTLGSRSRGLPGAAHRGLFGTRQGTKLSELSTRLSERAHDTRSFLTTYVLPLWWMTGVLILLANELPGSSAPRTGYAWWVVISVVALFADWWLTSRIWPYLDLTLGFLALAAGMVLFPFVAVPIWLFVRGSHSRTGSQRGIPIVVFIVVTLIVMLAIT